MQKIMMAIIACWICAAGETLAQQQTEIYIPIGESPGVSGSYSDVGRIVGFDENSRMLTLAHGNGTRPVHITGDTDIWLDRSAARQRNITGGVSDLVPGRRAEVKYTDATGRQSAAWVKVEVGD